MNFLRIFKSVWCFPATVLGEVLVELFQKLAGGGRSSPRAPQSAKFFSAFFFSKLLLCHLARRRLASRSGKRVFAQSKSPRCFLLAPPSCKRKVGKTFCNSVRLLCVFWRARGREAAKTRGKRRDREKSRAFQ